MENEHSQTNANNLDETVISTENSISTCVEDTADQSVLEIINEIPIIEVLEETASFVVEDTGVIHIRKEPVSTINSVNEKQEEQTDKSEKTDKANGPEITTGSQVFGYNNIYLTIIYCRYQKGRFSFAQERIYYS